MSRTGTSDRKTKEDILKDYFKRNYYQLTIISLQDEKRFQQQYE